MQKTIYIATPELWESIKAMTNGKSISSYLVGLHLDHVANAEERAATIQEEIDLVDALPDLDAGSL